MNDESRKAFAGRMIELGWTEHDTRRYGGVGGFLSSVLENAYIGWSARDAEIEALKARAKSLEAELVSVKSVSQ